MKNLTFIALTSFFVFFIGTLKAQYNNNIYIGQPVDSVQNMVATEVQGHYSAKSYLTKLYAETHYRNKQIYEVMLCKQNILVPELQKSLDYCLFYEIVRDRLSYIITKYRNLTAIEAKRVYFAGKTNIGGYYFDPGFRYYYRIVADDSSGLNIEYRKTEFDRLPFTIQEQLKVIAKDWK